MRVKSKIKGCRRSTKRIAWCVEKRWKRRQRQRPRPRPHRHHARTSSLTLSFVPPILPPPFPKPSINLSTTLPPLPQTHAKPSSDKQESAHKARKSASRVVLSKMQFTLHVTRRTPHGASRLVHAMSDWSVKTRRAPSRHCRDARVYTL